MRIEGGMKRSGSLIVLDAPSKRVDGGAAADEVEGERSRPNQNATSATLSSA